ncbi:hypothetical protein SLS58_002881 [Diplodia intermedia]|uniref:Protein kinase domain-containing protein n=1 Tax=Diplodia intermedia TaxID=856260 RepID=A0ABR3TXV5_9PEZI
MSVPMSPEGAVIARSDSSMIVDFRDPAHDTPDAPAKQVMKTNFDHDKYEAESNAYRRIQLVEGLRNRVPTVHTLGDTLGCSIIMEKLDGDLLRDVINGLSPEQRSVMQAYLKTTLEMLHRDAGVYHGNVCSKNIIVHDGVPKLLDFGLATIVSDVPNPVRKNYVNRDLLSLDGIFAEFTSREAHDEALAHMERMRHNSAYYPESTMAKLLPRIAYPTKELIDAITELFDKPSPELALPLARNIAHQFSLSRAVRILLECSARFHEPSSDSQNELVLEMKERAARYTARHKETNEDELKPSTRELFNDVIDFHMRTCPEAVRQQGHASEKVLDLRLELATHLYDNVAYVDTLEVCEEALDKAGATGMLVGEGFVRRFRKLLRDVLEEFERAIDEIEEDKLKGREHRWTPWSKLEEHTAHRSRAEQALSICEDLLSAHQRRG